MPYTSSGVQVLYLFQDADLSKSTTTIPLPAATTLADAQTFAITNMSPLVTAISSTQPYGANIVMTRTRDGAPASGTGEKEMKGTFLIQTDARGKPTTRIEIPGISPALLASNNKDIDQTNALVETFLQGILRGKQADGTTDIVTGITGCVSSRGYGLVNFSTVPNGVRIKSAYKYHRASGKGTKRRAG
jgi:hypothetical protein